MTVRSIDGLTMPAPGIEVLRGVMNHHVRLIVADYLALTGPTIPERLGVPARVRALLTTDPRCVVRVLRTPMIAGLVGAARRLRAHEAASYRALTHALELSMLTELSAWGGLEDEVVVSTRPHAVLRSTGRREVIRGGDATRLAFSNERIARIDGDAYTTLVGEEAYFEIVDGILFATSDGNPLLAVKAHPERDGNSVDLGGMPVAAWLDALRAAFAIIRAHAPETYAEMRLALELVVPVGHHPERHFSVSYRDSVGAVYLTLHPNVMTLAEALIHEFQHNKLNAVFHFDPVLEDASAITFTSPIRPDARPLTGVLMAAHAFLPVARLYESMIEAGHPLTLGHDFEKRFDEIVRVNHDAATTLRAHARPTPLGAGLLDEIHRSDAHFMRTRGAHARGRA